MEKRENKHRKALENIYGSNAKAVSYEPTSRQPAISALQYNGSIPLRQAANQQSLPVLGPRPQPVGLMKSYERVNPSHYGYNLQNNPIYS